MKNISIKPYDSSIKLMVESLNILNEFKMLGFTSRSGFVGVVQDNVEEFKDYKTLTKLLNFWDGRKKCEDLNETLTQLLDKLKQE